jgi:hypothetical protein
MALLPSSALTFLNIAYFTAPVSPVAFNQADYSWADAVKGWATAASDPASFNNANNANAPTYGYLISPSTGGAKQYVLEVYRNLFGKSEAQIAAADLTYWTDWLNTYGNDTYIGKDGTNYGIASYQALALAVYEYSATADELAALANRQEVSQYFSSQMQDNPSGSVPSFNTAQYNAGWASISTVTNDAATVATAKASIDIYVATTGSVGNSFALTPDPDIKSANQFLAAPVAGTAGGVLNTFTSGDQLTGVGENPTLTILWQNDTAGINTVQPTKMQDVSTLNATLVGNDLTVLSTFVVGLKTVNINDTSAALKMTNLQSALETISINRSFTGANATFTIAEAALAGAEDTLAIKLNQVVSDGGNNTVLNVSNLSQSGGYEKVSVESKGFANTIEVAGVKGVQDLTITGDRDLTLAPTAAVLPLFDTSIDTSIKNIDASTFTANLTATVGSPLNDVTFLGGSKVDDFTINGDGNHSLTGNDGDDLLTVFGDGNNSLTGSDGVDILTVTGNGNQTIAGDAGADIISVTGDGNHVITGGADGDTIDLTVNIIATGGDVDVSGGEGDDRITFFDGFTKTDVVAGDTGVNTLAFDSPGEAEAITAADSNITGIQTLALTTPGTPAATLRADFFGTEVNTVTLENGVPGAYTIIYNTGANTLNVWNIPFPTETGVLSVGNSGTATTDKLTLNLVGDPTGEGFKNDIVVGGLNLDLVDGTTEIYTESLEIDSSNALTFHTIQGAITMAEVPAVTETITVTGNSGLTVGGAITADKVDASALTGANGLTMNFAMGNAGNGATVLGSLSGQNKLQGTILNDKITAGNAGDTLIGNLGADVLVGGTGIDTFEQFAGATLGAGSGFGAATLTEGSLAQLTFPLSPAPTDPLSGPDIVQGFQTTDKFNTGVAGYTQLDVGDVIAANQNYGIRGNYTASGTGAGTFSVNTIAGNDLLVFTAAGAGLNNAASLGTNLTVLQGEGALTLTGVANFVV